MSFLPGVAVVPSKLTPPDKPTKPWALTTLCAGLLALTAMTGHALGEETVTPTELDRHNPAPVAIGEVTFLAGFELELDDPDFGGLSGLDISPDGTHLTAVSDQGWWLTADLAHDETGRLVSVGGLALSPLLDLDGEALAARPGIQSKLWGDAEGLGRAADGGFYVCFERKHRLWRYGGLDAVPVAIDLPAEVAHLKANSGLEAVGLLPDGRLMILAEKPTDDDRTIADWLLEDGAWRALAYRARDGFSVTDMAVLPDGRIIVLERWFREPIFMKIRLREITPAMLEADAPIDGRILATFTNSLRIDNFEGLAMRPAPDGGYLLYMISDDNFSAYQRTLLYQFHLEAE
jgi:hypothetical protein